MYDAAHDLMTGTELSSSGLPTWSAPRIVNIGLARTQAGSQGTTTPTGPYSTTYSSTYTTPPTYSTPSSYL